MHEQGLGDELFFLRFCRELNRRGAKIYYRPASAIHTLCERIDGHDTDSGNPPEEEYSIADLPYLLNCSDFLPSVSISPLEDRLSAMTSHLEKAGPAPYIGVTYRAGIAEPGSLYKEAPIDGIASALAGRGGTFINVQRNPIQMELEFLTGRLGDQLKDFTVYSDDLEDMLALVTLLDDYVGVSNTNMHLRAAAAKPARVLVTHPGEYRWMAAGAQSPWFPDFKLYRQNIDGNWQHAFDVLAADLKAAYG